MYGNGGSGYKTMGIQNSTLEYVLSSFLLISLIACDCIILPHLSSCVTIVSPLKIKLCMLCRLQVLLIVEEDYGAHTHTPDLENRTCDIHMRSKHRRCNIIYTHEILHRQLVYTQKICINVYTTRSTNKQRFGVAWMMMCKSQMAAIGLVRISSITLD